MSYKVLGRVSHRFDSSDTLLKKQVAAARYLKLLAEGFEILNIDESILRATDQRRRGWSLPKNKILVSHSKRLSQVSMIAGISSLGKVFFSVNKGKNSSLTFRFFMTKLV